MSRPVDLAAPPADDDDLIRVLGSIERDGKLPPWVSKRDLYTDVPEVVTATCQAVPGGDGRPVFYVLTGLRSMGGHDLHVSRTAGPGYWRIDKTHAIWPTAGEAGSSSSGGAPLGTSSALAFFLRAPGGAETRNGWLMKELVLRHRRGQAAGYALCKIYKKKLSKKAAAAAAAAAGRQPPLLPPLRSGCAPCSAATASPPSGCAPASAATASPPSGCAPCSAATTSLPSGCAPASAATASPPSGCAPCSAATASPPSGCAPASAATASPPSGCAPCSAATTSLPSGCAPASAATASPPSGCAPASAATASPPSGCAPASAATASPPSGCAPCSAATTSLPSGCAPASAATASPPSGCAPASAATASPPPSGSTPSSSRKWLLLELEGSSSPPKTGHRLTIKRVFNLLQLDDEDIEEGEIEETLGDRKKRAKAASENAALILAPDDILHLKTVVA
ncbi:hypothetical protein ZWY2020_000007 [Hordeum vulgare]|nr:hypothetical protein ZWY2020_000007 [Hordeum vulgare]